MCNDGAGTEDLSTPVRIRLALSELRHPRGICLYFVTPAGSDPAAAPDNHSDRFFVDEAGIQVGLRSLLHVAVDYLQADSAR